MSITLYADSDFLSPYAMSVFVGLVEKKLDFELKTVDLGAGEHKLAPFQQLASTGRVPTLVHGDFVLTESSAITEYLDDFFPSPDFAALYPRDPQQRAIARQLQAWVRSDLLALRQDRSTVVVFKQASDKPLSEAGQVAANRLIAYAERLVDGPNLFGSWCIADTDLALILNRLVHNGDPVPERLAAYAKAQWQRPSVQQWLGHI